jgi:hypothetical protein
VLSILNKSTRPNPSLESGPLKPHAVSKIVKMSTTTNKDASARLARDTTGFSATNFHLSNDDKKTLFDNGVTATEKFLADWDWDAWRANNPARAPRPEFQARP